jgi:hypothetical protein
MSGLENITLMEEDPWKFYISIRPVILKCLQDNVQLHATYDSLHDYASSWLSSDQEFVIRRVEDAGFVYGGDPPCPMESLFLINQIESMMRRRPYRMLSTIHVLLYSIIGDTLRKVLLNCFWRIFHYSFNPDLTWMEDMGFPWVEQYRLPFHLAFYICQLKDTYA